MDRIESGTRLHGLRRSGGARRPRPTDRVAAARDRLGLEPIDIVAATAEQMTNDVAEHEYSHILDIAPGERTADYLGVWMTLAELEVPGRHLRP